MGVATPTGDAPDDGGPRAVTFDAFLEHFHGVRRAGARYTMECPAHEDRSRNTLHVKVAGDGRRLLTCRAGCRTIDVLTRASLQFRDLFPPSEGPARRAAPPVTDTTPWPRLLHLALRDTYREARRRQRETHELYARGDEIRVTRALIDEVRRRAPTWDALALAADAERDVFQLENL